MRYDEMNENDILRLCKSGDDEAMEYIFSKYKNYVKKKARELFIVGGDVDDLIQEGMIGLYKAIRDYSEEKDASFMTFASLCISRQLFTAVKASNCKKHTPLNTSVSYDTKVVSASGNEMYLADTISMVTSQNPEEAIIGKERLEIINKSIVESLSKYENQVFEMYMEGMTYIQIGDALNKQPKSIDNAIQRIKGKIQKIIEKLEME